MCAYRYRYPPSGYAKPISNEHKIIRRYLSAVRPHTVRSPVRCSPAGAVSSARVFRSRLRPYAQLLTREAIATRTPARNHSAGEGSSRLCLFRLMGCFAFLFLGLGVPPAKHIQSQPQPVATRQTHGQTQSCSVIRPRQFTLNPSLPAKPTRKITSAQPGEHTPPDTRAGGVLSAVRLLSGVDCSASAPPSSHPNQKTITPPREHPTPEAESEDVTPGDDAKPTRAVNRLPKHKHTGTHKQTPAQAPLHRRGWPPPAVRVLSRLCSAGCFGSATPPEASDTRRTIRRGRTRKVTNHV